MNDKVQSILGVDVEDFAFAASLGFRELSSDTKSMRQLSLPSPELPECLSDPLAFDPALYKRYSHKPRLTQQHVELPGASCDSFDFLPLFEDG